MIGYTVIVILNILAIIFGVAFLCKSEGGKISASDRKLKNNGWGSTTFMLIIYVSAYFDLFRENLNWLAIIIIALFAGRSIESIQRRSRELSVSDKDIVVAIFVSIFYIVASTFYVVLYR